jgi:hypothetical protein
LILTHDWSATGKAGSDYLAAMHAEPDGKSIFKKSKSVTLEAGTKY